MKELTHIKSFLVPLLYLKFLIMIFSILFQFSIDKPQRGKKITPPHPVKICMDTLVITG